jgi:MYXO-CTERM domain-containing protein
MRKIIATATLTAALAAIQVTQTVSATAPPDTVTSAVVDDNDDADNTGLWGLLGLLGLAGLAGLRGRRDHGTTVAPGVSAAPPTANGASSAADRVP